MFRLGSTLLLLFLFTACSTRVEMVPTPRSAGPININTASVDELEKLPYVGRATAERIVDFREQNGPFRRVEQLLLIRGMSEKRLAELRPLLRAE